MVVSSESNQWVGHTHEVLEKLQDLLFAMESIELSSREFASTGEQSYIDSYRAAALRAERDQVAIRHLTRDNPEQQRQIPVLERLISQHTQRAEMIIIRRSAQGSAATAGRPSPGTMDQFLVVVGKLQSEELRLLELRNADTRTRLSQTRIFLIFGTVLGLLITAAAGWSVEHDNSARGRAEGALKDSEEKYRMLVDGVQDYAIFMLDPHGQVVSWNAGAERIKGYTADQIIGRNFSCFFPTEDIKRGKPEEVIRSAATSGRHEEHGMRVRKDGSQFLARIFRDQPRSQ